MKTLDSFLSSHKLPNRCRTCKMDDIREVLNSFLERKAAGDTYMSLNQFHRDFLIPQMKYRLSYEALYRHCTHCLEVDVKTGKPNVES